MQRPTVRPLLILLLITLFGGALRFYRLTCPPLWNDETLVYWRVCGTYGQMLVPLRRDMFPPLHYSLYWLIGQLHTLTPWTMRLVPAVAGTLSIPAIYFLARQMLSSGTSLLAAAFTACSAFMLFYSRDAKMYSDLWLFVILNVACLLWWFRTRALTAWLCWVAAGCAATGLHFSALVIPALSPIFLLTQSRFHWQQIFWFLFGIALILAGPIGFFTRFNPVADRLQTQGWNATGISWVGPFKNADRTGPELARYAGTAMLMGYEWPRYDYTPDRQEEALEPISPPLVECPETAATEILSILAMAALPWRIFLRPRRDPTAEPQWRVLLWLGSWILLVGYAYYIPSEAGFVPPRAWVDQAADWLGLPGETLLIAITATFMLTCAVHRQSRPALLRLLQALAVIACLYAACTVICTIMSSVLKAAEEKGKPIGSLWEPRYLGILWPAVAIATAALLLRLPTRSVRIACIFFVLAVNLLMASLRLAINTEAPIDRLAADIYAGQDPASTVRTFDFIQIGDQAVAGSAMSRDPKVASGRYYLQMLSNHQPMSPDVFAHSLELYNRHNDPRYKTVKEIASAAPQLKRVIIWSQLFPHDPELGNKHQPLAFDPYRRALPDWKLASEDVYTIRIYWDWRERWQWVRREYARRNAE